VSSPQLHYGRGRGEKSKVEAGRRFRLERVLSVDEFKMAGKEKTELIGF